ncbi:MAG: AAA family ATPase [Methanobacteriaceae archaeon]|nr:AAA family ATPase [Methanobacteriaceae archaeon]
MTARKKTGGALGKGLDALIKSEESKAPEEVEKPKPLKKTARTKTPKPTPRLASSKTPAPDQTIQDVLLEVHKNPRISLWSARSAAVLRFLKKTRPEFSISKEASALIEAAVEDKYPDIWKLFADQEV